MLRLVWVVACVLLVTGCGGNSKASDSPATTPDYTSAQAVADAASLMDCESTPTGHDFATEVTCGQRAVVVNFDEGDELDQWLRNWLANAQSGVSGVLYGNRWAIACPDRDVCSNLKGNIGGTLKP